MAKEKATSENFHYNNIEKKDKNFMYKNFRRSNCYNCNFSNSNFNFATFRGAHFKTCSFMNGSFEGSEFIGTNLKNSKFKNSKFKNSIFEGANLDGADFKDARFENTIFLGCKIEKTRNFNKEDKGIRIFDDMPMIELSSKLKEALADFQENKFVKSSRIFDTKNGEINTLTLMVLLEKFDEEQLIQGLKSIKDQIDRDFYTISYIIRLIEKNLD